MKARIMASGLVPGAALLIAACGSPATAPAASQSAKAAVVMTATKTVSGKSETVLTNQQGLTLYWFKPDSATVIVCTGGCAATWPPLVAPAGPLQAPAGLSGTLSALDGPNGHQVLYNGHPLYTYSKDMNSGDAFGDGVGGKWSVATPDLAGASAY
jgi:predicted lipoprotein with Yx(FWY)xxD motif